MHFFKKIRAGRHLLRRLTKDPRLRTSAALLLSLTLRTAYVFFQLISGLYYRGRWFYALAFYDAFLILTRFFLLRSLTREGRDPLYEYRRYRLCGRALLIAMPALITIVTLIVLAERPLAYRGITTLTVSLYTLAAFAWAIYSSFKYRHACNPLLSAAKALSLTAASVSFLSLEIACLFSFGNPQGLVFRRLVTGISGGGVCIFVLLLSLHMMQRGKRACRLLENHMIFKQ